MKRRALRFSLLLALCLALLTGPALAAALPFTDVSADAWYYNDVKSAYESGLINGKSDLSFAPADNLTYGEAVKLAACMHQKYTSGSVTLKNGSPWYQSYVDYAKTNGIISVDYSWDSTATRAGYMQIFASSLPDSALGQINNVSDGAIPDVPTTHANAAAIYKLYRAGVVQGSDAQRNCNPSANIQRSEVAAILTRMMDSSARMEFSLVFEAAAETPVVSLKTPATVSLDYFADGTFTVAATVKDGGTLSYRWEIRYEGVDWTKLTSEGTERTGMESASLTSGFGTNAAQYQLRCKVTNTKGDLTAAAYSPVITVNMTEAEVEAVTITLKTPDTVKLDYLAESTFTIEAKANDGGTLSYWWELSYVGLDWWAMMNDASDSSAGITTPSLTTRFGTNAEQYFLRCKVTSTKDGETTVAYSPTIIVNMIGPETPRVSLTNRYPETTISLAYYEEHTFRVLASVTDGGTLSYSWEISGEGYEWAPVRNEGTENAKGMDTSALTIKFGTNLSQYLLRCKVTNTKNGVTAVAYSPTFTVNMFEG